MAPTYGADCFLDSDTGEDCELSGHNLGRLQRPWKAWWPPEKDSELYGWLSTQYPEALRWRFDPQKPFDRPWQKWRNASYPSALGCPTTVLPAASENDPNSVQEEPTDKKVMELPMVSDGSTNAVERLVETLRLRSVTPDRFNYLAPLHRYKTEKPYHSRLPFLNGLKRTNIVGQSYSNVQIYDLTGAESNFPLHEAGFEFVNIPVTDPNWTDSFVRERYLPDMKTWLEQRFKCEKAHIYAYNFRSRGDAPTVTEPWIGPFLRAHADVTAKSSISRMKLHLSWNDEKIRKKRYKFVAYVLWRPLSGPRLDCPLAVCDFRSLKKEDVVEADIVFPHYCDEGYEVINRSSHKWFFKPEMNPGEAILFNLFDPDPSNATFCIHSAFVDPMRDADTPPRRSVELRAILEW